MIQAEKMKRISSEESPIDPVKQLKKDAKLHIQISKIKEENEEDSEDDHQSLSDKQATVNKTKIPIKELKGHKKAIRDLAYCETQKLLISCGFDFQIFVWNPYVEKYIIKLDGHESPLVGVSVVNSNYFVSCETKGMVKVWNINELSCVQTFHVSNVN